MNRNRLLRAIPAIILGILTCTSAVAQPTASSSLSDYERLAALGDASAAEKAGRILYDGRSQDGSTVPRDLGRARSYLSQAAKSGSTSARTLLDRIDASVVPPDAGGYVPGPYGC